MYVCKGNNPLLIQLQNLIQIRWPSFDDEIKGFKRYEDNSFFMKRTRFVVNCNGYLVVFEGKLTKKT